jgi:hypothetical protein
MTDTAAAAQYPQLDATQLGPQAHDVLVRVLRVAFPHPQFGDGPYQRTAEKILAEAAASPWWRVALAGGLNSLNTVAGGNFTSLPDSDALALLRQLETSTFFGFIRRTAVLNLYDDPEVWQALGYEGPSFDKGGYLHRGFDDLDWLPDPRITEYDGPEQFVAFSTGRFSSVAATQSERTPDTSNQPGQHEAEMEAVEK